MSDEAPHRLLTEMLTEIGRADLQIDAPGALEERVLRRWDRDVAAKAARIRWRPRRPGLLSHGAGALAAAMLLLVLVHRSWRGPIAVGVPVARPEVRARAAAVNAPTVAVSPPGVETRPIAVVRAQPEMKPPRIETPSELVSYIPLSPEAHQDLSGSFQVARVLLPREVLADLGVVLDASRVGEPIQADVVFGEDGLARAIRLAGQDTRRSQ